MDSALAAALLPLAPSPRLAGLRARLTAAGVSDIRVLAGLMREDAYEVPADILGIEDAFDEAECGLIVTFIEKVGIGSTVAKRVRSADTHADDVIPLQWHRKEERRLYAERVGPGDGHVSLHVKVRRPERAQG